MDMDINLNCFYFKHKTQSQTRNEFTKDQVYSYITDNWKSEKFCAKDLISTNTSQPCMMTDARFTFISKFLNKRNKRAGKEEDNSDIPNKFLELLESDIFASISINDIINTSTSTSIN